MPPHRSVRRRRRHELSRSSSLEENVTERTSAQAHRHSPINTSGSLCRDEQTASVQKPQMASAITATSSSWLQSQDTMRVTPPSSSVFPRVWARLEMNWGYTVYIRLDLQGSFHTYPDLGGPYRSLQEADVAIDRHLDELRDPKMFMVQEGETSLDVMIRRSLYWPDGTSKRSKSCAMQRMNDQMRRLAQALLDKYNEDHHLLGGVAYELKDVLGRNSISERGSCYYHLNFTTNTKDSDSSTSNLFFAEVKHLNQWKHEEVFVCCLCTVNPIDKGQHCNGCFMLGAEIKHPDSSVALAAGYLDPRCQFGGLMIVRDWNNSKDLRDAEEAHLRRMYEGLDDPKVIASLFTPPPRVTIAREKRGAGAQWRNINRASMLKLRSYGVKGLGAQWRNSSRANLC